MAIKKLDPSARFKLICEFDDTLIPETTEELEALKTGKKDAEGNDEYAPTRYQQYLENLDESKLKMKVDSKPSYFVVRCLTNGEMGELQEEFFEYDVKNKRPQIKGSKTKYFQKIFELGVLGMIDENNIQAAVTSDQIGYGVMVSLGSSVSIFTQLGKHSKKS